MLNQDDLASFRLKIRSDVVGTWKIESTTYNHFYCQVKIVVSGCGFMSAISRSRKTHWGLQLEEDSFAIKEQQRRITSHNLESSRQRRRCLWVLEKARTTWTS